MIIIGEGQMAQYNIKERPALLGAPLLEKIIILYLVLRGELYPAPPMYHALPAG